MMVTLNGLFGVGKSALVLTDHAGDCVQIKVSADKFSRLVIRTLP
jgi:hypothetical protein